MKGLERARWATADMAFRRSALAAVGGFDERFTRAYREDADLGLRLVAAGYAIAQGRRKVFHPVRPGTVLESVRAQAGNADDVLMTALHGRAWNDRADAPRGRRPAHLATVGAGLTALGAAALGRGASASLLGAAWLAATAELAWRRIAPGPRTPSEVATMAVTSVLIPPAATYHWLRGHVRKRRLLRDLERAPRPEPPAAVLLDRDGTLVHDVPYNADPRRVTPVADARTALDRLRAAGVPLAVVSNQSGVGRGLITHEELCAVNRRVEELLGPIEAWHVCVHAPDERCGCRKPEPGLVVQAAEALQVDPSRCALIGDIGSDVEAAQAAGARAILVPTHVTRAEEVRRAPEVARTLTEAVDLLLGPGR